MTAKETAALQTIHEALQAMNRKLDAAIAKLEQAVMEAPKPRKRPKKAATQ